MAVEPAVLEFVGREHELAALEGALRVATEGRGGLYLLGGEPGIGKTRLSAEFAKRAENIGAWVYWGRCWEAGGAPAYWPWIQSLRELVGDLSADTLDVVVGNDGPELSQLLPELAPHRKTPLSKPMSGDVARFQLFDAIDRFLHRASESRPLVLILEDLHAADTASLLLLQFLSASVTSRRLLIVATYRDVEVTRDHPLSSIIAELVRGPATLRSGLQGLTEEDAAKMIELVSGESPTEEAVAAIHRGTNGNPLFVGEVVRLLATQEMLRTPGVQDRMRVPEGLREVIGRRLAGLPEDCQGILATASVFGHSFVADSLVGVTGNDYDAVLVCLDRAVAIQLLARVPTEEPRYRFAHALVRDALYDEIPPTERMRLHRSVGEALEELYSADLSIHVAELAYHFLSAAPLGDLPKAVDFAAAAGRRAVDLLAYEEAVRLFTDASDALKGSSDAYRRCELLLLLGDAEVRAGSTATAKKTLLEAAELAAGLDDAELLARIALTYAGRVPFLRAGIDRHVVPLLREALAKIGGADSVVRVQLLGRLAGALRSEWSDRERTRLAAEAVVMARRIGDPETLVYALLAGWFATLVNPDLLEEQVAVAEELDSLADAVQDPERKMDARLPRYVALMTRGHAWEAREQLQSMSRIYEELRLPSQLFTVSALSMAMALQDGRFEEVERLVADFPGRGAQPWDAGMSRLFELFLLRREQGRLGEFEDELRRAPVDYPGYRSIRCMLLAALCDLGRLDEARALFDRLAADDFAGFPKDNELLFALTLLAEAAHALDDTDRAAVLYEQLLPYADLVGLAASEVSTGPIGRPLGLLAVVLGQRDDAIAHFEDAIERSKQMGARPWAAHTQYAYADMLVETGRVTDRRRAIQLLRTALGTATEIGMIALGDRASRALADLEAQSGVTPREREIAVLVADGLSNRQIAGQLVISERTVETHVQNLLTKLGFNTRTQIARWVLVTFEHGAAT